MMSSGEYSQGERIPPLKDPLEQLEGAPEAITSEGSTASKSVVVSESPSSRELEQDRAELSEFNMFHESLGDLSRELVEGFKGDRALRRPLAIYVCIVTGIWLLGVLLIVVAAALYESVKVPESVQLALLGSATLAIIGLLATILTYYFTNRDLTKAFFIKILDRLKNK